MWPFLLPRSSVRPGCSYHQDSTLHRDDPLAGLSWSAADYADLTSTVASLAPEPGRLIAFLEGGYDLHALALSAGATVAAMAGQSYRPEPPTSGGPGREQVEWWAGLRQRARDGMI